MKTIKFNKDKTVQLITWKRYGVSNTSCSKESNSLTRIIDLKGGNWNECVRDTDSDGKTTITPVYPTYYKIGDYYYV